MNGCDLVYLVMIVDGAHRVRAYLVVSNAKMLFEDIVPPKSSLIQSLRRLLVGAPLRSYS